MTLTTWIILAVISLMFSALFSGTEIAYITADRVRMELDSKRGGLINHFVQKFFSDSDLFISTILVGNNIMLVIYGIPYNRRIFSKKHIPHQPQSLAQALCSAGNVFLHYPLPHSHIHHVAFQSAHEDVRHQNSCFTNGNTLGW